MNIYVVLLLISYMKMDEWSIFKQDVRIYVVLLLISFLKIDEWSTFKQEMSDRAATHANTSGDPISSTQGMPRGRDRILSIQRIPHGRDPIFSTQRITRRLDPILAFFFCLRKGKKPKTGIRNQNSFERVCVAMRILSQMMREFIEWESFSS